MDNEWRPQPGHGNHSPASEWDEPVPRNPDPVTDKRRGSPKPRAKVPEHVRNKNIARPTPGQGTFGAERDGERAAADFLARAETPEPSSTRRQRDGSG